jgi:hypothetical protein
MQRSPFQFIAIATLALSGLVACADEGVGDPCIPENVPCKETDDNGNCVNRGYDRSESFIESSSVQCRSRLCIVHKLKSSNGPTQVTDPTVPCKGDADDPDNCVKPEALDDSVYCTCRCGGPKTSVEFCQCPHGFECTEILKLGGDGVKGSYCVKPEQD